VPTHYLTHYRRETDMNKRAVLSQSILLIALVLCLSATTTVAQDMAKVAPNNVKVLLDNDKTRVLDVQFKTGEKLPMHSHPAYVVYSFSDAKVKTTLDDGKVTETEFKAGGARWSDKVTHANEALTDVHLLVIEIKDHKAMMKK
jgi:quercetin dioxygenase-like cupin family protein